jgi:hypothetical protein
MGSSNYSDSENDAPSDGRNPRHQPEPVPHTIEDNPSDLVGPPAFGYKI